MLFLMRNMQVYQFLKKYYQANIYPRVRETLDEIQHPGNNPRAVAESMAIGIFIGLSVPLGLQLIAFTFLLIVIRYNFIIANFVSLISNPFTILPIYYVAIHIGEFFLGEKFSWEYFDTFMENPTWDNLFNFEFQGIIILLAGLLLMAIPGAIITYLLSFKISSFLKKEKKVL